MQEATQALKRKPKRAQRKGPFSLTKIMGVKGKKASLVLVDLKELNL
jgi:hypothetical protein